MNKIEMCSFSVIEMLRHVAPNIDPTGMGKINMKRVQSILDFRDSN
jgi:hypothetical protein